MKTNIIKAFLVLFLIGIFVIPSSTFAEQLMTVEGVNINGADANITPNNPPLTTGGSNINGADSNPTPSVSPSPSSSSGGGSIIPSGSSVITITPNPISAQTCSSYLNDYLKFGGNNNKAEVNKLQTYLKYAEKLDVDVNGIFDQKTVDAVKTFQKKYVVDVMGPWGGNIPTGQVYFTTKKKINEIYCNIKLSLTAEQLAQIESYKKSRQEGALDLGLKNTNITSTGTIPLLQEVGSNASDTQMAAVAGSSISSKIWGFVKWLFGY